MPGQRVDYYKNAAWDVMNNELVSARPAVREIAYWRKHPNLHGWMEKLWFLKGRPMVAGGDPPPDEEGWSIFNSIEMELNWDDLDKLERDILSGYVRSLGTSGFFFGDASDEHYREYDLEFVKKAKAEVFCGLRVFYNSSW